MRILDIGYGARVTGQRLKERAIKEVAGVELNKDAYGEAQKHLDKIFLGDIEKIELPFGKGSFDSIIYGDRLEHP